MKDNNIMQKSMAGVGGQPQLNAINYLDLANSPFCPTAEPRVPEHLANYSNVEIRAHLAFQLRMKGGAA